MAARGRMIDTKFWTSETIAGLTMRQRLLWIGLFSNADDQGRLRGHPALVRSLVFPFDDVTIEDVRADLAEIAGQGCIQMYSVDGTEYIQVLNWWRYQQLRWAWPSKLPAPDGWVDRLCYRKGNAVVKANWGEAEATAESDAVESEASPEPLESHGGVIVESERGQSGATVRSAPSGRGSNSTSGSNSGSDSNSNTRARERRVAAVAELTCDHPEICKDFAERDLVRVGCAGADRLAVMRGPRFAGCWCYAADQDQSVKNPGAFVAGMIRQGISPPVPPPDWDGWNVYCSGECAGSGPVENGRLTADDLREAIALEKEISTAGWLPGNVKQHEREIQEMERHLAELEGAEVDVVDLVDGEDEHGRTGTKGEGR